MEDLREMAMKAKADLLALGTAMENFDSLSKEDQAYVMDRMQIIEMAICRLKEISKEADTGVC